MSFQGKKNLYVCEVCGHHIFTVDRDAGTTPFMTPCEECKGTMVSHMYRVNQHVRVTHEWYSPSTDELEIATLGKVFHHAAAIREHVKRGGLLLRRIRKH